MAAGAPQRMCLACRTKRPQQTLARIQKGPDDRVRLDATPRSGGRGAYVCASEACVERAMEPRLLVKALRLAQPPSAEEIETLTETLTARIRAWETASEQRGTADGR